MPKLIVCSLMAVSICISGTARAKSVARDVNRFARVLDRMAPLKASTMTSGGQSRLKRHRGTEIWRFAVPSKGYRSVTLTYKGERGMIKTRDLSVGPGMKSTRYVTYSWPNKARLTVFYDHKGGKVLPASAWLEPKGHHGDLKKITLAEARSYLKQHGPWQRQLPLGRRLTQGAKHVLKGVGGWLHNRALLLNAALQD